MSIEHETARERAARDALLPAALDAARRGDEHAFMLIYHWRARAVWASARLAMPADASRATVRAVFHRVWRALPDCRARDAVEFDAWLVGELGDIVMARRPESTPEVAAWDLPVALRETLLLRDVFGHGLDQVARAFETPADTVRLWYRRGLEAVAA